MGDEARRDPSTAHTRVYREIKTRIVQRRYGPGDPLGEVTLAQAHRASRTPVREALSRLHQEGYVERVPRRGYTVSRVTGSTIEHTMEVRMCLEGLAAKRAARYATAAEIDTLRKLCGYAYAVGDAASYRRAAAANDRFHLAIAAAGRNTVAADLIRHCLTQMGRWLALGVEYAPFQDRASGQHHAIVDAIARRDGRGARIAMERHLARSAKLLQRAVASGALARA